MEESAPGIRRDLEFFPLQHDGRQFILVRDPLGLVQEGRALAAPLFRIISLLDGSRTLRDLQSLLMRQAGGALVGMEELRDLLIHLDEAFLLNSDRFRAAKEGLIADFTSKESRPPSHSGRAYPSDPSELTERLSAILSLRPGGEELAGRLRALVSPHIDLSVGGVGYAWAYGALRGRNPSRVAVLGIGHQMQGGIFSVTEKDFETPLGTVSNDRGLSRRLRETGGEVMAENDFDHRSEHSIEFQAVFLKHLLQGDFKLLPILCGSLPHNLKEYSRRAYLEKAGPFLRALREILADPAEETLLVAAVDLSHVGPKFGHELSAKALEKECSLHDRKLMEHATGMDPEGFWQESIRLRDRYNVCGFSALACMLEVLPPCTGTLLHYGFWHEEATRSGVSFSAAVFTS